MYCSCLFMCCFGDFALFCLDSVVSGESVFAGEEFEEFQGQQGKSHRSQTTLWACWSYLKLLFLFNYCIYFRMSLGGINLFFVIALLFLITLFLDTLGYNNLTGWTLFILVQLDIRYNCLALLRNISSLLG